MPNTEYTNLEQFADLLTTIPINLERRGSEPIIYATDHPSNLKLPNTTSPAAAVSLELSHRHTAFLFRQKGREEDAFAWEKDADLIAQDSTRYDTLWATNLLDSLWKITERYKKEGLWLLY